MRLGIAAVILWALTAAAAHAAPPMLLEVWVGDRTDNQSVKLTADGDRLLMEETDFAALKLSLPVRAVDGKIDLNAIKGLSAYIAKALLVLAVLACAPSPAFAVLCGTTLDPMTVTATPLNFGNYIPSSASTSTITVNVSCGLLGVDILPAFTVSLSNGNATAATGRYMDNGGGKHMSYNIYNTNSYSNVLGDGTSGTALQSYAGLLSIGTLSFTGYGQIPSGQFLPAGSYSDHIVVTISY